MADLNDFNRVFSFNPKFVYPAKVVNSITNHRRTLHNMLFLDRLLSLLHIDKATKLYPPSSNEELRRLHKTIVSSTCPDHHKQSLLYYILLDCHEVPQAAESFAEEYHLPEKYAIYMTGLWYMDQMQFHDALEWLTQPSLIPTFPEEILVTLARHAPPNDPTLPLAYYHSVSPVLTSPKSLEVLFVCICRASVTEAFYFARRQSEAMQKHLLEMLISFVLSNSRGAERASKSIELVNLPLTEQEELWFEDYLSNGKGRTLKGAKDTMTMRGIGSGRFRQVLNDKKGPTGKKIDGVNWETLKEGLANGLGPNLDSAPGGT